MLSIFRYVGMLEGVTTVLLFFVAMPLKYFAGQPLLIPPIGWIHGLAFIVYGVTMVGALWGRRVGARGWLRTVLAAFVPLGTFANDRYLHDLQTRAAASQRR